MTFIAFVSPMSLQEQWEEFLRESARYGDTEDVIKAFAQPVTVNVDAADAQGATALHMAAANGHEDIVRVLISRGAAHKANATGNTPLRTFSPPYPQHAACPLRPASSTDRCPRLRRLGRPERPPRCGEVSLRAIRGTRCISQE